MSEVLLTTNVSLGLFLFNGKKYRCTMHATNTENLNQSVLQKTYQSVQDLLYMHEGYLATHTDESHQRAFQHITKLDSNGLHTTTQNVFQTHNFDLNSIRENLSLPLQEHFQAVDNVRADQIFRDISIHSTTFHREEAQPEQSVPWYSNLWNKATNLLPRWNKKESQNEPAILKPFYEIIQNNQLNTLKVTTLKEKIDSLKKLRSNQITYNTHKSAIDHLLQIFEDALENFRKERGKRPVKLQKT